MFSRVKSSHMNRNPHGLGSRFPHVNFVSWSCEFAMLTSNSRVSLFESDFCVSCASLITNYTIDSRLFWSFFFTKCR